MITLMNEMIAEAQNKGFSDSNYQFVRRMTPSGEVMLSAQIVNTQTKNNEFRRDWQLNGKRIAARKLASLS